MQDEKTVKIIEAVRNMTDQEADILEVFISGFRAGKQVSGQEAGSEMSSQSHKRHEPDEHDPAF